MALKLMYITNRPDVASIVEAAGVDRVFVDLEYIGKAARQGGMDTVQNRHTLDDVAAIADTLTTAELMVRLNPVHDAMPDVPSTKEEIDGAIAGGAQVLMLPYFKTADEVRTFVELVDGRVKTFPLLETPEAAAVLPEILTIDGIDEMHIGINDMSLGMGRRFMFELLADGTVESLCRQIGARGIPYGFGGIAKLGGGMLPAEMVIREHYRLGSTRAILSRSFCNTEQVTDLDEVKRIFQDGVRAIRSLEADCAADAFDLEANHRDVVRAVARIVEGLHA